MNPSVWVLVIMWDGDREEDIIVATTPERARREAVKILQELWAYHPAQFQEDDVEEFMKEWGDNVCGLPLDQIADDGVEQWLEEFRESTTSPWWSLEEVEVLL